MRLHASGQGRRAIEPCLVEQMINNFFAVAPAIPNLQNFGGTPAIETVQIPSRDLPAAAPEQHCLKGTLSVLPGRIVQHPAQGCGIVIGVKHHVAHRLGHKVRKRVSVERFDLEVGLRAQFFRTRKNRSDTV